ncbi:MAG: hypothetical protein IJJ33_10465, partial [Victivallales bacterium]|nr:hypothetical protein [Victivallales bacterium]
MKSIPTWFGSHLPSWCVILLVMHSLHSAIAGVPAMEEWYFLPNFGKDIRGIERMESALGFPSRLSEVANALLAPGGGLSEQERKLVKWHPATFPHQDFVGMMPGRKVFGWYACVFDVPENKANQDLLVDLGLIDDADECYLNGQRIGGMGRVPGGSAWQSDRLYRVPAEKVRQTGNYLA